MLQEHQQILEIGISRSLPASSDDEIAEFILLSFWLPVLLPACTLVTFFAMRESLPRVGDAREEESYDSRWKDYDQGWGVRHVT
jgi:hypothetical protein